MLSTIDSSVNRSPGGDPTSTLRAAAVQLTATPDKAANAQAADRLVRRAAADLDLDAQAAIRTRLPSLANRRPAAYRWPED
jgi:predicted amidohydrolase